MDYFSYYTYKDKMPIEFIIEDEPMEVIPPEPKRKATMSNSFILYHLRITFNEKLSKLYLDSEGLEGQVAFVKQLLKFLRAYTQHWVYGIEEFKRGMVNTTPHVHIVFLSKDKKDTIRKALNRQYTNMVGNRMYALKVLPNQTIKEYRYVLKQQKNETHRHASISREMAEYLRGEYATDIQQMTDEAYAVWLTACEVADAKDNKDAEAKGLQDRLMAYLNIHRPVEDLEIKVRIQKFYMEEEKKPFNKTTALGYFWNYKISSGLMTHEQLAKLW